MKANLDTVYFPLKDLAVKEIHGELLIIPIKAGKADLENGLFKISETGKAMWDKLDGRKTLREICQELSLEYDAPVEMIERDMLGLVEELLQRGYKLRSEEMRPNSSRDGQEFSLSGALTVELLQAAFSKGARFRLQVKGSSMAPFINDSDVVTLSPLSVSPATLGKTVACVIPPHKKLVVHRIVARKRNRYLIKGDSGPEPDCLIRKEEILGCVTSVERQNRTISFGLGIERIAIALLSRNGLLPLVYSFWQRIPKPLRGFIKGRMLL